MSSTSSSPGPTPDSTHSGAQLTSPSPASLSLSTLPPNHPPVNTSARSALHPLPSETLQPHDREETPPPSSPTASEVTVSSQFTAATSIEDGEHGHDHSGGCRCVDPRFLPPFDREKERREKLALTERHGNPRRGRAGKRRALQSPSTSKMSSPLSQTAVSRQEQGTSESIVSSPHSTGLPTLSAPPSDTSEERMALELLDVWEVVIQMQL
ncbi:hypothetical protein BCR39DRAFT_506186 [Naematelia encephala]|uniref:Uncharacterized protein n=1 Tax=Naematelia encephala TaxID=71784 RepID=A0A1Y2AYH7_9TREE|nr:hypothetical protein BCR39DRAFT_506186 [Naematelia encephala]